MTSPGDGADASGGVVSAGAVIVGVGMSSRATVAEVAALVEEALRAAGVSIDAVTLVATRLRFVDDHRLRLGPPVRGYDDDVLVEASRPPDRDVGLQARVAQTAASLAAAPGRHAVRALRRSAYATVAVVTTPDTASPDTASPDVVR